MRRPGRELALDALRPRLGAAVVGVAIALALVAGVTAAIGHVAEWSRLRRDLDAIAPGWVAVAVGGLAVAYGGYVLAYRRMAAVDGGPELSAWTVTRVVALGFGATVLGATVGGLAVDYWALRRAGCSTHDAVRRVLGLNTLQWAALGAAAAVAGAAALAGLAGAIPAGMALAWVVVVPLSAAAGLWVSAPGRSARLADVERARGTARRAPRALRPPLYAVRIALAEAVGGLAYVRAALRRPVAVLGFPLYWVGHLVALGSALQAFGERVGPAALVLAFATGYAATALPLPVGGAGGVDAAITLTVHAVGVPLSAALLGTLLYRAVSFWLPILPALAMLPAARGLERSLREAAS